RAADPNHQHGQHIEPGQMHSGQSMTNATGTPPVDQSAQSAQAASQSPYTYGTMYTYQQTTEQQTQSTTPSGQSTDATATERANALSGNADANASANTLGSMVQK